MLDKYDVERIVENVLRGLTLEMGDTDDSEMRCILLKLNGQEIDRVYFDVV